MADMVATRKLPARTKLFYGVGDVGNAMANSAISFFLLVFLTDAALVAPALAGSALLVGKIYDAINDPLFGWASDRTTSRFGKRRVHMILGALPLMLLLFAIPLLIWYSITRESHAEVLEKLEAMKLGRDA